MRLQKVVPAGYQMPRDQDTVGKLLTSEGDPVASKDTKVRYTQTLMPSLARLLPVDVS